VIEPIPFELRFTGFLAQLIAYTQFPLPKTAGHPAEVDLPE
jgi:hypothetical protein